MLRRSNLFLWHGHKLYIFLSSIWLLHYNIFGDSLQYVVLITENYTRFSNNYLLSKLLIPCLISGQNVISFKAYFLFLSGYLSFRCKQLFGPNCIINLQIFLSPALFVYISLSYRATRRNNLLTYFITDIKLH